MNLEFRRITSGPFAGHSVLSVPTTLHPQLAEIAAALSADIEAERAETQRVMDTVDRILSPKQQNNAEVKEAITSKLAEDSFANAAPRTINDLFRADQASTGRPAGDRPDEEERLRGYLAQAIADAEANGGWGKKAGPTYTHGLGSLERPPETQSVSESTEDRLARSAARNFGKRGAAPIPEEKDRTPETQPVFERRGTITPRDIAIYGPIHAARRALIDATGWDRAAVDQHFADAFRTKYDTAPYPDSPAGPISPDPRWMNRAIGNMPDQVDTAPADYVAPFQIGDVVQLASGGLPMTVEDVDQCPVCGRWTVDLLWFDERGDLQQLWGVGTEILEMVTL